MIIDKDLSKYIAFSHDTISTSIEKIIKNKGRIIFVVNDRGILEGLFTNGDLLRWIAKQETVSLDHSVSKIINRDYLVATTNDNPAKIKQHLNKVLFVPIVDDHRRLVAVARRRKPFEGIKIGDHIIEEGFPVFTIAEIGNNHNGCLDLAKKLIEEAARSGAHCAKFQMRNLKSLYRNAGNPNDAKENLGSQYTLDLLSRFQLSKADMFFAFDYCKEIGILPLCTPWDSESLDALEEYGMPAYKVASADLTNHDLLAKLCETGKPIICSTGMSTEHEIIEATNLMSNMGAQFILLLCNSTYPAPFKDINLNYLGRLKEIGNCPVGYSGHERGISVAIAAVARGARVIEKHLTLDRSMEGNDHKISLLPDEFQKMVESICQVEESLGSSTARHLSQGELANRVALAKSLVINCDLKAGQIIEANMVEVKSPGQGLQPNRKAELIGREAKRDFKAGDIFYPSDLVNEAVKARHYKFQRAWGLPVRYHDFGKVIKKTNPDFIEFHFSYKDLEENVHQFIDRQYDLDLIVHSPELFSGDHILDLCSDSPGYRKRSIIELQKTVNVTLSLKPFFKKAVRPLIIANVGGFTVNAPLQASERKKKYQLLINSLSEINTTDVEIIPQTMPPFPWHFGGQRYHNLFVDAKEIVNFCRLYGYRVCLDISHSKLACNHFHWSFKGFIRQVGPFTAHFHIADAKDIDGEGLQLGEGDIDFPALASDLDIASPDASFIPEIWQGHENEGEGFWIALDILEKTFGSL